MERRVYAAFKIAQCSINIHNHASDIIFNNKQIALEYFSARQWGHKEKSTGNDFLIPIFREAGGKFPRSCLTCLLFSEYNFESEEL